ncbi:MAG: MMPL family transporter [Deltaproteobacteria bacterium]|nr:MMPL family transporter [Deltaproteobacteria bacterium]
MFERFGRWALRHARPLFIAAGCLTAASIATLPSIRVDTSRTNLVSPHNPWQAAYQRYLDEFGAPPPLVVFLEGANVDALRAVARELDDTLLRVPNVQRVFSRLDLLSLGLVAFSQSDEATRTRVVSDLRRAKPLIEAIAKGGGLVGLFNVVADEAERHGRRKRGDGPQMAGAGGVDGGVATEARHPEEVREGLDALASIFRVLSELVRMGDDGSRAARMRSPELKGLDELGYVTGRDGKSLVITVEPTSHNDSAEYLSPFVRGVRDNVRAAVRRAEAAHGTSIRAGVTGIPATVIDELDAIASDTFVTTFLSFVFVAILIFAGCRSVRTTALALSPLVIGIAWSVGYVMVTVGHFNLITSTFMSTALGLGIDYAIHMYMNFVDEARVGREGAIEKAVGRVGPGILTTALATIASFLCLLMVELRAFQDLGVIAAVGMVLIVVATLFLFPKMLTFATISKAESVAPRWTAWLERLLTRHPKSVVLAAIAITLALLPGAFGLRFDYNLAELLPRKAESIETQARLSRLTDFSGEYLVATADSIKEARRIEADFRALPSVGRVESIAPVISKALLEPGPSGGSVTRDDLVVRVARAVDALGPALRTLAEVAAPFAGMMALLPPLNRDALDKSLGRLGRVLTVARFVLVGPALVGVRAAEGGLREFRAALDSVAADEGTRRLRLVEAHGWSLARTLVDRWRELTVRGDDGLGMRVAMGQSLQTVIGRFVGRSGKFAVYAYPKESIWEREPLERYIAETRRVSPNVTGFPATFFEISRGIQRSILIAGGVSFAIVILLVWLDFRRIRDVFLALFPIAMGALWMLGLMKIANMSFNLANLVGVPLVTGMAVESGIYIIHRRRQLETFSLQEIFSGTGRGVIYSAITTIAAFGALALAQHRGIASMGFLLLTGISACLVTSLVVMPALLRWMEGRE